MRNNSFKELATSALADWQDERPWGNNPLHRESRKICLYIGNGLFSINNLHSKSQILAGDWQRVESSCYRS